MKCKKIISRKVISMLLTLALLMIMTYEMAQGTQAVSVQAAKPNKAKDLKAKKAYAKKLRNTKNPDYSEWKFALIDLNKDGISEMVTTPDDCYHLSIDAYVNGKVKSVGWGYSGGQEYYPNKHLYFSQTTHENSDIYTYYKFTGKKLKTLAKKEGRMDINILTGKPKSSYKELTFKPYKYTIKGKKVSAKKYNTYVKKLLSDAKEVNLKLYKNTYENRKKLLYETEKKYNKIEQEILCQKSIYP